LYTKFGKDFLSNSQVPWVLVIKCLFTDIIDVFKRGFQ